MDKIYKDRQYDVDVNYSEFNPVYLHRIKSLEKLILKTLNGFGYSSSIDSMRVLDYGCGNGRWLGKWLSWGVRSENLYGVDVRTDAIESARSLLSIGNQLHCLASENPEPWPDGLMDICFCNVVLTSILSDDIRKQAADYIINATRPGGLILLCDFVFDNPRNNHVRSLSDLEVRSLFQGAFTVSSEKVILAPPIARFLVPFSWSIATVVESTCPFLRTHKLWVLRKHENL